MNRPLAILTGLGILATAIAGCANESLSKLTDVEIVSVRLADWRDPDSGKVFVVAMPKWKNAGTQDIQQVIFAANVKGKEGTTGREPHEPQFYGTVVEPGTTVESHRVPEDGVILGEKSDLVEIAPEDVEMPGIGSSEPYVPPRQPGG